MAYILELSTFTDSSGSLTVCEKVVPFDIKRSYWIYNVKDSERGGHRHKKTVQALVCVNGSCEVFCDNGKDTSFTYLLDSPSKCLIVEPEDWHTMNNFSTGTVLLVLASEYYDKDDYISERYR